MADTPKKILFLITKSNYGGAQKYVYELATAAKAAGFAVVVAAGGTGGAGATAGLLLEMIVKADIDARHITYFQRNMSPFDDVRALFEVWKLLRLERPDILHVTSSKAGGIGAFAGRLVGIKKIIFTSHGLTVDEVWRPRWQRILIYLGTWLTLRLAHHSIMISNETYERARALPGMEERVTLIQNGIAPIQFLERKVARAKLAPLLPPTTLWVGGIGELHPNKNWVMAIIAMTSLKKHVHLFIIGEGQERTTLERIIVHHHLEDRVHLLGFLDAPQYLKAFDIFLLPSLKEGLPYVLLEAGLAELPTIASDLPGNRDIITSGETGLLIAPTPPLLATTLEMLSRDDGMRRRLGYAHKEFVTEHFSIKRMCEQTFALYASSAVDA